MPDISYTNQPINQPINANSRVITSNSTLVPEDGVIMCNATSAPITLTLPSPNDVLNRQYMVTKENTNTNNITLAGIINSNTNYVLSGITKPSVTIVAVGGSVGWRLI